MYGVLIYMSVTDGAYVRTTETRTVCFQRRQALPARDRADTFPNGHYKIRSEQQRDNADDDTDTSPRPTQLDASVLMDEYGDEDPGDRYNALQDNRRYCDNYLRAMGMTRIFAAIRATAPASISPCSRRGAEPPEASASG